MEGVTDEASLEKQIKEELTHQKEHELHHKYEEDCLDKAASKMKIDIAPELLDEEVEHMYTDFMKRMQMQGISEEMYYPQEPVQDQQYARQDQAQYQPVPEQYQQPAEIPYQQMPGQYNGYQYQQPAEMQYQQPAGTQYVQGSADPYAGSNSDPYGAPVQQQSYDPLAFLNGEGNEGGNQNV